jgi:hypothetical protein
MHVVVCYMFVASNKYDGVMFINVRDKRNGCEETGFPIVYIIRTRIKIYLRHKRNERWK